MYNLCIRSAARPGYRGEELFADDTSCLYADWFAPDEMSGSFSTLQKHLLIDRVLLGAWWQKDMHAAHTGKCSLVKIGFPVSCSN